MRAFLARLLLDGFFLAAAAAGATLLAAAAAPTDAVKRRVDAWAPDGRAETITPEAVRVYQRRSGIAGGAVLAVAAALLPLRRRGIAAASALLDSIAAEGGRLAATGRAAWRADPPGHRAALAAILLTGTALRVAEIDQPIRHDEAFTYVNYVSRPLVVGLSHYSSPNNHFLHTALAHGSCAVFGNAPWTLRLPVFIAGVLLVPAVYALARRFYGREAAVLAAAAAASSPVLIEYSANARGYMLQALAFAALLGSARALLRRPTPAAWALLVSAGVVGFYANPSMLYAWGTVALLVTSCLAASAASPARWALAAAATAAGSAVLYLPPFVVSRFRTLLADPMLQPVPWPRFFTDLGIQSRETLAFWGAGVPAWAFALFLAGIGVSLIRVRDPHVAPRRIALAAAGCLALLAAVKPVVPFPRLVLFLGVLGILFGAAGIGRTVARLAGGRSGAFCDLLAVLLAASVGWASWRERPFDATVEFPEAAAAAAHFETLLEEGDCVVGVCPLDAPLQYHFMRRGIPDTALALNPEKDPPSGARLASPGVRRFLILVNGRRETLEGLIEKTGLARLPHGPPRLERRFGDVALYAAEGPGGAR